MLNQSTLFEALLGGAVLVLLLGIVTLLLGVATWRSIQPPAASPKLNGPRPLEVSSGYVQHQEEMLVQVPLAFFNRWSTEQELGDLLKGMSGIPAVARTEMIKGTWEKVGARRLVALDDGHFTAEEVLINEKPARFRYMVWGYTNALNLMVDHAIGEFKLTATENGQTRVSWIYAFHKRSLSAALLLPIFVNRIWVNFMKQVLVVMKTESEKAYRQR